MKSKKRKRRDFVERVIEIAIGLIIIFAALWLFCGLASLILIICGVG